MRNLHPATKVALVALMVFVIVLLWLFRWLQNDPADQPGTAGSVAVVGTR